MSEQFVNSLKASKDEDFIALAELNNTEIKFYDYPQPRTSVKHIKVGINHPFEGTIYKSTLKDIRGLR